jgi:hypothetical protein
MINTTAADYGTYDITLRGSIIGEAFGVTAARLRALELSLSFPDRLVRAHGLDGETIIFECRNGVTEFESAEDSLFGWTR